MTIVADALGVLVSGPFMTDRQSNCEHHSKTGSCTFYHVLEKTQSR